MALFYFWIVIFLTHCGFIRSECPDTPEPCSNFEELSEPNRDVDYALVVGSQENDFQLEQNWYRFVGENDNDVYDMPAYEMETGQCNAFSPIWINDTLPSPEAGIKTVHACATFLHDPCVRDYTIPVKNCGNFRVYCLSPTQDQYDRFCVERTPGSTHAYMTTSEGLVTSNVHTTTQESQEDSTGPQEQVITSDTEKKTNETIIIVCVVVVLSLLIIVAVAICVVIVRRKSKKEDKALNDSKSDDENGTNSCEVDINQRQSAPSIQGNFDDLASIRSISDTNHYDKLYTK